MILDHILCSKENRKLDNSQEFSYSGKKFQIVKSAYSNWIPPRAEITVMISPQIGIKAAYRNMVFETNPAGPKVKKKTSENKAESKSAIEQSTKRSEFAWNPIDGMQWQPGLPTYREVFDIVQEIFERPYSKPKGKPPTIAHGDHTSVAMTQSASSADYM